MAITVNWPTKIINVPKEDMTLIQETPVEIRELNLNTFRLTLKSLEDDEQGITYVKTHNHVAPIDVGGLTLARVIELVNSYTVTFEDDQYAVNLVGGNSNIGDRVNVNQVSVRSFNTAGLIISAEQEQDLNTTRKMTSNKAIKNGNTVTIYEDNGYTIWKKFDTTDGNRIPI